jgi:adenine-specific DNA-methyltransferase
MKTKSNQNLSKENLLAEIERLKKELKEKKKYGLVWEDKPEDVAGLCKTKLPILVDVKDKGISRNKNGPTNILIEGDNYHALSVLNYTHKGHVDVIYIDPPYNLGGKDFRYNDRYVEATDAYRHSMWLSFMYKRLVLAKYLLKPNGVIFISINDIEVAQLKMMLNSIFGENNSYATITWINRTKSTNSGKAKKMPQQNIEYVLMYGKKNKTVFPGLDLLYSEKAKTYPHNGKYGKCRFENLEATDYGRKKRDTMKFKILGIKPRPGRRWQLGYDEAMDLIKQGKIEIVDGIPKRAVYPEDEEEFSFIPFWSHLIDTGTAEDAKKELSLILGPDHGFDTVKPLGLIHNLLKRFDKNCIVLDFFAGSATTGHTILTMNKIDNGRRQFILCTNNENSICDDVCYPRIKKVMTGYKNSKGQKVNGLGGKLKYYKTDFVDAAPTDKNKKKLTERATEMLCLKEDTFEEIVSEKTFRVYKNSSHYTGIIFDQIAIPDFKKTVEKMKGMFSVYIFSLGDETFDDEFKDVKQKVRLSPIPEAILRVYRRIFK